jgi:hypothetical protein
MKKRVGLMALLVAGGVYASPGAHGPNGEHLDTGSTTPASGLARLPDGSVNVPMLAQRRLAIRTAVALESEAVATVELPARVIADPNASGRVQTAIGGKVDAGPNGLPFAGQTVRRGQVLATVVHHAEPLALATQQAQLAEIRGNRATAEQRVERLKGLEGTVPRKEIDAAVTELRSLQARERALGASVGAREPLVSPISGVVARADVVAGQVVESKDVLFEVVDPTRLLVEATTPDPTLSARLGTASLKAIPGVRLELVGAARSLRDGVLPLTFTAAPEAKESQLPLAVGQSVTVVAGLHETVKGFVLPAQAITRNPANEPVVWIKAGAERYIPQPVQYRALDANRVVVTHGLGADNRVVVQGAALIAQIR